MNWRVAWSGLRELADPVRASVLRERDEALAKLADTTDRAEDLEGRLAEAERARDAAIARSGEAWEVAGVVRRRAERAEARLARREADLPLRARAIVAQVADRLHARIRSSSIPTPVSEPPDAPTQPGPELERELAELG